MFCGCVSLASGFGLYAVLPGEQSPGLDFVLVGRGWNFFEMNGWMLRWSQDRKNR